MLHQSLSEPHHRHEAAQSRLPRVSPEAASSASECRCAADILEDAYGSLEAMITSFSPNEIGDAQTVLEEQIGKLRARATRFEDDSKCGGV